MRGDGRASEGGHRGVGFGRVGRVQPTVFLWDIDGTLISTAGAGRRAIELTFQRRYGRPEVVGFHFDGMTDPVIVRQGLAALGLERGGDGARAAEILREYLVDLAEVCAAATDFRVHAGIEAALALCHGRPGFAVGLGTGNVEEGARLKLGARRSQPPLLVRRLRQRPRRPGRAAGHRRAARPRPPGRGRRALPGGGHRRHAQGHRRRAGHRRRVDRRRHRLVSACRRCATTAPPTRSPDLADPAATRRAAGNGDRQG